LDRRLSDIISKRKHPKIQFQRERLKFEKLMLDGRNCE